MDVIGQALLESMAMLWTLDPRLIDVIVLSLKVSLSAVVIASIIGVPVAACLTMTRFPGRKIILVVFNALMGLPPVVVGLVVYLLLSRSGPFGVFNLLFTPTAMIIAQVVLVTPIIVSLARESLESMRIEYHDTLRSIGASPLQAMMVILWDGRFTLATAHLAGFGRAIAEVGAVMIVGGNIDHLTRVMTTAIALEASKGDLVVALALGVVLVLLSLSVNVLVTVLRAVGEVRAAS
ncbi:MAG: tungstate transport system permease protein [Alphaproteobacteria bacterium]|jgi:tungstate transport system permease protein